MKALEHSGGAKVEADGDKAYKKRIALLGRAEDERREREQRKRDEPETIKEGVKPQVTNEGPSDYA